MQVFKLSKKNYLTRRDRLRLLFVKMRYKIVPDEGYPFTFRYVAFKFYEGKMYIYDSKTVKNTDKKTMKKIAKRLK
jgi:hypothetical protein